jgi:GGDEF domain-containing protein
MTTQADDFGFIPDEPAKPTSQADDFGFIPDPPSPEEKAQVSEQRTKTIWDIGSNIGPKHLEVMALNHELGDRDIANEKNYDKIKKANDSAKFDPAKFVVDNPARAELLKEHPEMMTQQVTEDLGIMQKAFRKAKAYWDWAGKVENSLGNAAVGKPAEPPPSFGDLGTSMDKAAEPKTFEAVVSPLAKEEPGLGHSYRVLKESIHNTGAYNDAARSRVTAAFARIGGASDETVWRLEQDARSLGSNAKELNNVYYGPTGTLLSVALDTQQAVQSSLATMGKGAMVAAAAGAATFAGATAITKSPQVAGRLAGKVASIGFRAGLTGESFRLEMGSFLLGADDLETDNGEKIDENTKIAMGVLYGGFAAFVEQANEMGVGLKAFGPLGKFVQKGDSKAFIKAIQSTAVGKKLIRKAIGALFERASGEGKEEAIQQAGQEVFGYLGRSIQAGEFQVPDIAGSTETVLQSWKSGYVGGAGSGAIQRSIGGMVTAPARLMAKRSAQAMQADESQTAAAQSDAVRELGKTKTAQARPDIAAKLIRKETKLAGSEFTTAHIETLPLVQELAKDGKDPVEAMRAIEGDEGADKLKLAMMTGQRYEMALEPYIAKFIPSGLADKLAKHTTRDQVLATPFDIEQEQKDIQDLAKQYIAEAEKTAWVPETQEEQQLFDAVESDLKATGKFSPKKVQETLAIHRAFIKSQVSRGSKPSDMMQLAALTVQRATPKETAEQMVKPGEDPYASRFLQVRVGLMKPEERARSMWVDENTQLWNERGLQALDPDPAKPMVAMLSLEGTKWKNTEGHTPGNDLYRAAGVALASVAQDAAKWRGDFAVRVGSEQEGQEVALKKENPELADQIKGLEIVASTAPIGDNIGAAVGAASKINVTERSNREKAGTRAKRGEKPIGIPTQSPQELRLSKEPAPMRGLTEKMLQEAPGLTERQVVEAAYLDQKTGMLSRDGFFALPKKKHVIAFDLNGLREINKKYGDDIGDEVLSLFADVARDAGASVMDMAHLSGDEYAAQTDDPLLAQEFVDILAGMSDNVVVRNTSGEEVLRGISFGYGIGTDYDTADKQIQSSKDLGRDAERLARGKRTSDRRSGSLSRRGDSLKRGTGPQVFPGQGGTAQEGAPRRGLGLAEKALGRLQQEFATLDKSDVKPLVRAIKQVLKTDPTAPFTDALADFTAIDDKNNVMGVAPKQKSGGENTLVAESLQKALQSIVSDSLGSDESPSQKQDALFWKWWNNGKKGEKPGPFNDSMFDIANEELGLKDENKVSGLAEAFTLLTDGRRDWDSISAAVDVLKQAPGLEWLRLPNAVIERMAADMEGERGPETLKQDDGKVFRGWVDLSKDGIKKAFKIFVTEHADPSTPIHELSHTYLEMMAQLAANPESPQQIKDDFAKALEFLGAKDFASLTKDQKETWAKAFEAYLMEGKAPSVGLVATFQRFRSWLLRVYKSVSSLGVELDDNIRGVFDRLLATDEEIEAVKAASNLQPMWKSATEAGMTEDGFKRYLADQDNAVTRATLRVRREIAEVTAKVQTEEWRKLVSQYKDEAAAEFDARPERRALRFIRSGEETHADGTINVDMSDKANGKLDIDLVRKLLKRGSAIEKKLHGRLVKGGLDPRDVAIKYGFKDEREMFDAILAMPDRKETIQAGAEEIARTNHPELDFNREMVEEKAIAAFHMEGTADSLVKEWQALLARGGIPGMPPLEALKIAASELANKMGLRQLSPGRALTKERSSAEKAMAAASKGDFARAALHKRDQILNHLLWGEVNKARSDRDSFEKLLSKVADRKRQALFGKSGKAYLDAANAITEAMGEKEPETDPAILAERTDFLDAVEALKAQGMEPGFNAARVSMLVLSPPPGGWMTMTLGDMRTVKDALSQLWSAARDANSVLVDGRRVAIDELAGLIENEAATLKHKGKLPLSKTAKKIKGQQTEKGSLLQGLEAALVRPQELFRQLGPTAYKIFWGGYLKARSDEDQLVRHVSKWFDDKWNKLPTEMQAHRFDTLTDLEGVPISPDSQRFGTNRDRTWMWIAALNMGNRSNIDRLLGGYGWDEGQVRDWLNRNMTEQEWAFVQSVWDLLDKELQPRMAEVYKDENGIEPTKIEPEAFTTPFGVFRGGYVPARYASESKSSRARDSEVLVNRFGGGRASVVKGFTKERVKGYTDIVDLSSWDVIPSHVMSVVHYVANQRFIKDTDNIFRNDRVQRVITERLGAAYPNAIDGWLKGIASYAADSIPQELNALYRITFGAKLRFSISTLAWSLPILGGDLFNPVTAVTLGHVSAADLGVAALKTTPLNYLSTRAAALAKSSELRHRQENLASSLKRQLEDVSFVGRNGKMSKFVRGARDSAWYLMEKADNITSTVIWEAAYRNAMGRELSETEAVAYADDTVHSVLPSHDTADLPAILRDKRGMAALVGFYGYFNTLYNVNRRLFAEKNAAEAMGRALATIIVTNVLAEFASGRGPEEDEEWLEWMMRKILSAPFQLAPLVGGPAEKVAGWFTSMLWHGEGRTRGVSIRSAAALAAAEQLVKVVGKITSEDRDIDQRILDALEAGGILSGTPFGSRQVMRVGRYLTSDNGLQEDLEYGTPFDVGSGVTYGDREGQPLNPFTAVEKALE